jgi:UDP-3-O-acyl-N-acetylglucosamine deacetylase
MGLPRLGGLTSGPTMQTVLSQRTLRDAIVVQGVDEMSGCPAYARISPGSPNTGYVLVTPNGEAFRATLDNASEHAASLMISGARQNVLTVEHVFATLYAYAISNARIEVWRRPSLSLRALQSIGLADTYSLPLAEGREQGLCRRIEEVGVVEQGVAQTRLALRTAQGDERLLLVPRAGTALAIRATTRYPVPGEQQFTMELSPRAYREQLAWSRPYGKLLKDRRHAWWVLQAFKWYGFPRFGFGHGIRMRNFIWHFSDREEWARQDVVRHTCVDRLGAIALLDGRLAGVEVRASGSGHAHDLEILRRVRPHLEAL